MTALHELGVFSFRFTLLFFCTGLSDFDVGGFAVNFSDRCTVLEHFRAEMSPNVWYGPIRSIFFLSFIEYN